MINAKQFIITNSYWYLIPILAFNIFYAPKLTSVGYLTQTNNIGFLGVLEPIFRIAIFTSPLIISINYRQPYFKAYLTLFIIGTLLYFSSWLMIIYLPNSALTASWWIQLAPAYLPLTWLMGIALMGEKTKWFIPISVIFVIIHTLSTYLKLGGTL